MSSRYNYRNPQLPAREARSVVCGIEMPKVSDVKNILLVLIIALVALSAGFAGAQQARKVPRIGYLGLDDPSSRLFESFRQGLREVGYIEGQNIIIESRFAYGN